MAIPYVTSDFFCCINFFRYLFLYSRTIRFSFRHSTYCLLIQYGLCRNL